jgi:hypothetical protein
MTKQIKTIIKFQRGTDGVNRGKTYGFVTKDGGRWRGCREGDSYKKRIVFVDSAISETIVPGILYKVALKATKDSQCFIATSAVLFKFEARIVTKIKKGVFMVCVCFGNKNVVYDPDSKNPRRNNIQSIADYIRHCPELKNAMQVAEDFLDSAFLVKTLYNKR